MFLQLGLIGRIDQKNKILSLLGGFYIYKCPLNTGFEQQKQPFQSTFRCPRPLNRGIHLVQVFFAVNVGTKFWDFTHCPLNEEFPLNAGLTVINSLIKRSLFYDLRKHTLPAYLNITETELLIL